MTTFRNKSIESLQSDMEDLLNSGSGDMVIKCEDKQIKVHSFLLGARWLLMTLI